MNRSKHSIFGKLRKSMSKAIRNARATWLSAASLQDRDTLTKKELQQRFPKKASRKLIKTLKRKQAKMARLKKLKSGPGQSKRTTPGAVSAQSSPANAHREGNRWIKNSTRKMRDQRTVAAHHGGIKK